MLKTESFLNSIFKVANFRPAKNTLHLVQNSKRDPYRKSSFCNVRFQEFGHFSFRFSTSSTKLGEIKLCKLDDKASPDPWLNCFCLLLDFFEKFVVCLVSLQKDMGTSARPPPPSPPPTTRQPPQQSAKTETSDKKNDATNTAQQKAPVRSLWVCKRVPRTGRDA